MFLRNMCALRGCEALAVADYRLSAQIISRAKGQSSIASAAYRAAARLDDPRTGEQHDYTRKGGVVFSAVLAPENAPEWMRDRGQLWAAVEAVEKRRDAQLARELQLSLPHELDDEQRRALVLGFVQEQFVARGMVADVAIHQPGRGGDERNHHAHVMVTMRTLMGDGFSNKKPQHTATERAAALNVEREAWALHQNRALERHGHAARVDHRSFEARGIDREATQHLGPTAADMERKGRPSRIGDENRTADFNNASRADRYLQQWDAEAQRDQAKQSFDAWSQRTAATISHSAEKTFERDRRSMSVRQTTQRNQLAAELAQRYGAQKAAIGAELQAVDRRLQARGVRRIVRGIFGRTNADEKTRQDLARVLSSIEKRETDTRRALLQRHKTEQAVLRERSEAGRQRRLAGIERKREQRERDGWTQPNRRAASFTEATRPRVTVPRAPNSTVPNFVAVPSMRMAPKGMPEPSQRQAAPRGAQPVPPAPQKPVGEAFRDAARPADPTPQTTPQAVPEPPTAGKTANPWESTFLSQKNPWESDLGRDRGASRERTPRDDTGPKNDKT